MARGWCCPTGCPGAHGTSGWHPRLLVLLVLRRDVVFSHPPQLCREINEQGGMEGSRNPPRGAGGSHCQRPSPPHWAAAQLPASLTSHKTLPPVPTASPVAQTINVMPITGKSLRDGGRKSRVIRRVRTRAASPLWEKSLLASECSRVSSQGFSHSAAT